MEEKRGIESFQSACSHDGYIVDQARVTDVRYGCRFSDTNGCGWIAVYNLLRCLGDPVPHEEIVLALSRHSLFRGLLGTSPLRVQRYLKKHGHPTRMYVGRKAAAGAAETIQNGILVYRHTQGWHYVAFVRPGEDPGLRYFNAGLPSKRVLTMDAFLTEQNLTPFVLLLAPKGNAETPEGKC